MTQELNEAVASTRVAANSLWDEMFARAFFLHKPGTDPVVLLGRSMAFKRPDDPSDQGVWNAIVDRIRRHAKREEGEGVERYMCKADLGDGAGERAVHITIEDDRIVSRLTSCTKVDEALARLEGLPI